MSGTVLVVEQASDIVRSNRRQAGKVGLGTGDIKIVKVSGTSARDYLISLFDTVGVFESYDLSTQELLEIQLKAANELLQVRRLSIPTLGRRVDDTDVRVINRLEDIVPLLFSHTSYKSYPLAFLTQGRWDQLRRWFNMLTTVPVGPEAVAEVKDIDEFIDALWAAGHHATVTNGTTGKVSLLDRSPLDDERYYSWSRRMWGWPNVIPEEPKRHLFKFTPTGGPYIMMHATEVQTRYFSRPDSIHLLTPAPLRVSAGVKAAEMRNRLADGRATPSEIETWQKQLAAQAEQAQARARKMAEMIIEFRNEPMIIGGPWLQMWNVMQLARQMGVGDGEFHPETVLTCGGGTKGADLPPNYREQILRFLGPVRFNQAYSMSEMSFNMPMCEAGNYHTTPWIIPLVLDRAGEVMLPREGLVEGRFAFLDLGFEQRWGGMISGDRVTMDFSETCPCGRKGAVMLPGITRYSDIPGDDKITCAGTVDGYIRGALAG